MTFEQLEALKTIVELGSFRAASEALNKAQSAVSYAIKNLEAELGVKVFSRESYRPSLTPEGEAIYKKSLLALNSVGEIQELARSLSKGVEPEISVAISAPAPLDCFTQAFKNFRESYQQTKLKLLVEVLTTIDRIAEGDADIGISEIGADIVGHSRNDFVFKPLGKVEMLPVVGKSHELCGVKNVHKNTLTNFPHIVLRSSNQNRSAGVLPASLTWSVADYMTKKQLLLAGLGWGFMPLHLIEDELSQGQLVSLDAADLKPLKLGINVFRRKEKKLGPAGQALWELLSNVKLKGEKHG